METKKDDRISNNFKLSEFKYVMPEKLLLTVLERLRVKCKNNPIIITDSARHPREHIKIYKNHEKKGVLKDRWYKVIPWGSYHLPKFAKNLRAVDIKVIKEKNKKENEIDFYPGNELFYMLKEIEKEMNIFLGIGVGREFIHVDVCRPASVTWYYSY